jgi:predicted LPLAT superfamily acyltransferase
MSDTHWSQRGEKAAGYWQFSLIKWLFRFFPVIILRLLAFPVGFFYFLFSPDARENSKIYLRRLAAETGKKYSPLKHIISFALELVEKVEAWGGKAFFKRIHYQDDDINNLIDDLEAGRGVMLLGSHLGNMEFIRALAGLNRTGLKRAVPVNAIVDIGVTLHFDRLIRELNPGAAFRVINARDMGPETMVLLQERLAAGELVAMAADRTAPGAVSRQLRIPFLGEDAPFPYGPYFIAALLGAPLYAVFALRQKDLGLSSRYEMRLHRCPLSLDCGRREREGRIVELVRWFAALLERYCKLRPYQWYNFFDFWAQPAAQPEPVPGRNSDGESERRD